MAGDTLDTLIAVLRAQQEGPAATQQRLTAFFAAAAATVERTHRELRSVLLLVMRVTAHTSTGRDQLGRLRGGFSALLYQGRREGDVRKDIDAAFLAELATGAFLAALTNWLNDPRYPLASRMQQAASFVGDAVRSRPTSRGTPTAPRKRLSQVHG